MYHPNQSLPWAGPPPRPPPPPPPPEPRQSKVISQREYREKEVDGFNMLRNVIKTITGEERRTRQEVLRKATDLLLHYSEIGKQSMGQASNLAACEAPNSIPGPGDTTLAQSSYCSSQPSHWSQTWQSDTEFGAAAPHPRTHFHDQQSHFTSAMDSTFNQSSSSGYGEGFSDYYSRVFNSIDRCSPPLPSVETLCTRGTNGASQPGCWITFVNVDNHATA